MKESCFSTRHQNSNPGLKLKKQKFQCIMNKNILLRCSECGKEYSFGAYSCKCNNGVLLVEYDFKQVKSINELEDSSKFGI